MPSEGCLIFTSILWVRLHNLHSMIGLVYLIRQLNLPAWPSLGAFCTEAVPAIFLAYIMATSKVKCGLLN